MSAKRRNEQGSAITRCEAALRELAMGYPGVREDHPWEHSAYKVRNKVFLFTALTDEGLGLSLKLPESNVEALLLPFTTPTRYGLGKSGWVSASFGPTETPPLGVIRAWVDESYRAIAPKKLVAMLNGEAPAPAKAKKKAKKQAGVKQQASRKQPARPPAASKKAAKKKADRGTRRD